MLIKVINGHNLDDMRFHVSMRRFFCCLHRSTQLDSVLLFQFIHSAVFLSRGMCKCVCVCQLIFFVSFSFVSRGILNSCLTRRKIYYANIVYRYRVIVLLLKSLWIVHKSSASSQ